VITGLRYDLKERGRYAGDPSPRLNCAGFGMTATAHSAIALALRGVDGELGSDQSAAVGGGGADFQIAA
jgi:hypothetical protein